MMESGVVITGSIDYPITQDDRPLYGIEIGVTRTSPYIEEQDEPQYQRSVNQSVSVYDMLKCYTVNGAYELKMDSMIGTIEVGKKADLVILGQNILTCDAKDISDTQVVCTISDGRIVYQA